VRPDYPLPLGVFRAVEAPTYERMLEEQVKSATERQGGGDLEALLHSGETWVVDA
jgi:2-oxoglutarate ferredoxin oxidoreductase subunit beta